MRNSIRRRLCHSLLRYLKHRGSSEYSTNHLSLKTSGSAVVVVSCPVTESRTTMKFGMQDLIVVVTDSAQQLPISPLKNMRSLIVHRVSPAQVVVVQTSSISASR